MGRCKWWSKERGYGFITGDDGIDIFCHYREIVKSDSEEKVDLIEGQRVEFESRDTPKGTAAAQIVRL